MKTKVKEIFLSLLVGFGWWIFLLKDSTNDSGYEYNGVCCLLLSAGLAVTVFSAIFFGEIFQLNYFERFLVGIVGYLFSGLMSIFEIRSEFSSTFLPFIYTMNGKIYQSFS